MTVLRRHWLSGLLAILALALATAFIVGFGSRPATILSGAALDDALFIRLGQSLARGHWLGHYDQRTLVKGPGLPLFLAIAHHLHLPYVMALALFHTACSGFAAWVARHLTGSRIAGFALFAALLLMPTIYLGDMLRVTRDIFYASLTIAVAAAAIALATRRGLRPWTAAVVAGGLGAWWWLTREEGVWLLPTFGILALAPLLTRMPANITRGRWVVRAWQYAPIGAAALTGVGVVVLVGLINWAVYGSFVVNEIKERSFSGALQALQAVGGPYHREKVPVPKAARERVYPVSPTFAQIRAPILDGDLAPLYLTDSCSADIKLCGEFGAGWFMWTFREAAAHHGEHASPGKAKAFYGRIAREVDQACDQGRLQCAHWNLPLVQPVHPDQLDDVVVSAGKVFRAMTFRDPLNTQAAPSDLAAPDGKAMSAFLHQKDTLEPGSVTRTVRGWFRESGGRFFTVDPTPDAAVVGFERRKSKDLVRHFSDPGLGQNRFLLTVRCRSQGLCPVIVRLEDGGVLPLDLAKLTVSSQTVGEATFHVEETQASAPAASTANFSRPWVAFASGQNDVFRGLLMAGAAAFVVLLIHAAVTRRLSLVLVVCTALLAGVAARVALLAVIDAVAFWATGYGYALPAVPLMLIAAVVAIAEAARLAIARLRPGPTQPA